jgi:Na+-transporting NADH:ubiquinone oxidoreductase subunit NqrF
MQSFSIRVSDAEERAFRCGADDTILSGALRSGIGFAYECNSGGCGSYQFELLDGELTELQLDAPGLSPCARQRGKRLACQSVPASDCAIRVSLSQARIPAIAPQRQTLTFATARPLAPALSDRRIYLFYGGRGPQDICLPEILSADALLSQRVAVHTAISDDNAPCADQWTGEGGFVHDLVRKNLGAQISTFDYYFCGPPAMTEVVHRMLLIDYKVPANRLYFDRFY